ncbi:MAG TPA: hypothetical protein VMT03_09020 [Polyangia bacterium]|nr:hypothetical protein [Polyangia bacterium]
MSDRVAALALTALAIAGCAGVSASGGSLPTTGAGNSPGASATGGSRGGCLTDSCVPALEQPVVLAVEIDPPSSSPSAVTQILNRDVSTTDLYETAPAVVVSTVFSAPAGVTLPSSADIVLTVPPTIPGRPDLSFQSVSAPSMDSGQTVSASLSVPQDAEGTSAKLSFVPLPPADQSMPAYAYSMPVAPTMAAGLPGDDLVVSGQIQTALQQPPGSAFVARAFQNGSQVSNSALTSQTDGTFQVRIPSAASANPVTIQLSPIAPTGGGAQDAWFVSNPITATPGKNLGAITLPSYQKVTAYDIVVAMGAVVIPGVAVRAQASIGPATANSATIGTASYLSSGTTDTSGIALLSFLPGSGSTSTNSSIPYGVTATPPVGSAYGTACAKNVTPLPAGGSAAASTTTLATIMTGFRPNLGGTISTADGYRLANVTVTASGTPDPLDPLCPAPAAVTANTTTDANGSFGLPLDAGTYQLDYDPPAGSSAPRLTETVQVTQATTYAQHDVVLPVGARVTGTVVGRSDGQPIGSATVRFFKPQCDGSQSDCFGPARTPPQLAGKALTGSDGSFHLVVAAPSTP